MKTAVLIHLPLVLFAIFLTDCRSKPLSPAQSLKKQSLSGETKIPGDVELVFLKSSCTRGVFSPDGGQALALCTKAEDPTDQQSQLYLITLAGARERRVTWQDGRVGSADWIDRRHVIYSSTTDELKEIPFLPTKPPPEEVPSELYFSDLVGDRIERLTHRIGFDGYASFWPGSGAGSGAGDGRILYVSRQGNDDAILGIATDGKKPTSHLRGRSRFIRFPSGLNNGRIGWLQAAANQRGVNLHVSGAKAPLLKDRELLSLRTAPGGNGWILVESAGARGSRVLFLGPGPGCERVLAEVPLDVRFADASLNPPRLLLSLITGTQGVFALKALPGEGFTCPPASASLE